MPRMAVRRRMRKSSQIGHRACRLPEAGRLGGIPGQMAELGFARAARRLARLRRWRLRQGGAQAQERVLRNKAVRRRSLNTGPAEPRAWAL